MHLSSQNIGLCNTENSKRKLDPNVKHSKKSPIIEFEIPKALKDIQFNKTYFSNGLVTLRDSPLPLNDEKN